MEEKVRKKYKGNIHFTLIHCYYNDCVIVLEMLHP